MMSVRVVSWWYLLCVVAALNMAAWSLSAFTLNRRSHVLSPETYTTYRAQLLLSAVYVFGCAFRSIFPVYDVPRICVVDSWLSSVLIGRSLATLAELCFVAQWALMLREASRAAGSVVGNIASAALVPLIVIAEVCSWYSVLTTSNIGHVAEESIWGFSVMLLVASLVAIRPRCPAPLRTLLLAGCVAGAIYVAYMFLIDVPMYWSRWIADEVNGRHYMSIAQGARDVSMHGVVSHRWSDWKSEVVWMSLYFSVAVWISIALIHASQMAMRISAGRRKDLPSLVPLDSRNMVGRWL